MLHPFICNKVSEQLDLILTLLPGLVFTKLGNIMLALGLSKIAKDKLWNLLLGTSGVLITYWSVYWLIVTFNET
jgi:hypothetical protein